jgi:hypothetical protein
VHFFDDGFVLVFGARCGDGELVEHALAVSDPAVVSRHVLDSGAFHGREVSVLDEGQALDLVPQRVGVVDRDAGLGPVDAILEGLERRHAQLVGRQRPCTRERNDAGEGAGNDQSTSAAQGNCSSCLIPDLPDKLPCGRLCGR